MRFAEIALFVTPFLAFVAWRLLAPAGDAPRVVVVSVTVAVLAMTVLLLALWYQDAAPPGAGYEPARQESGRIVPEKMVPEKIVPEKIVPEKIVPLKNPPPPAPGQR